MDFAVDTFTGPLTGNITTLDALPLANLRGIERNLGYHEGRLAEGFAILLLKTKPEVDQFEFDGTTLRSGGKLGLPAATEAAEAARPRVHDQMMSERGEAEYKRTQQAALQQASILGARRLVKILPTIRHDKAMSANVQYPMGGGFLQWNIKAPGLAFYVAAKVSGDAVAEIRGETLALDTGKFAEDYPRRAKLQSYLQMA